MNELEEIKLRAEARRLRLCGVADIDGTLTRLEPMPTIPIVIEEHAEAEADLDRSVAIAEREIELRHEEFKLRYKWKDERDQARADVLKLRDELMKVAGAGLRSAIEVRCDTEHYEQHR